MAKKSVEKKTIIKEVTTEKPHKEKSVKEKVIHIHHRNPNIDAILVDNFVSLQKVMVNLSAKFGELTNQISKLLELFEVSAKALAEKDFDMEKNNKENAKILEKIEAVLEQNKTIARGLTLMHDKISEPSNIPSQSQAYYPSQLSMSRAPPAPQFKPAAPKPPMAGDVSEEFHRPIASNE